MAYKTLNELKVDDEVYEIYLGNARTTTVESISKKGKNTMMLKTKAYFIARRMDIRSSAFIADEWAYALFTTKEQAILCLQQKITLAEQKFQREKDKYNKMISQLQ